MRSSFRPSHAPAARLPPLELRIYLETFAESSDENVTASCSAYACKNVGQLYKRVLLLCVEDQTQLQLHHIVQTGAPRYHQIDQGQIWGLTEVCKFAPVVATDSCAHLI